MKPVIIYDQIDNRTVGIFEEDDGTFTAMSLSQSKTFKKLKSAESWIKKFL